MNANSVEALLEKEKASSIEALLEEEKDILKKEQEKHAMIKEDQTCPIYHRSRSIYCLKTVQYIVQNNIKQYLKMGTQS